MATTTLEPFAWPLALLLLGVVAIVVFRPPLSRFLDRAGALRVTKEGLRIDAAVAAASAQTDSKPVERGLELKSEAVQQVDIIRRPNISPLAREAEGRIRNDLIKLQLNEKPQESVDILVEHLATTQLLYNMERVYRLIFGSQIAVLTHMNLYGSAMRERLQLVYDLAKSQYPKTYEKYNFQSWINFLKANALISTSDDVNYEITIAGRGFLQWLVANGISEAKDF